MDDHSDDFELAVIELLGPAALAGEGMTIYEAAKLMYQRGRYDEAKAK